MPVATTRVVQLVTETREIYFHCQSKETFNEGPVILVGDIYVAPQNTAEFVSLSKYIVGAKFATIDTDQSHTGMHIQSETLVLH